MPARTSRGSPPTSSRSDGSGTLLPGTWVKEIAGTKVGFIGMTLEATPTIVNPAGVSTVDFKDEVETANAQAAVLKKQGVKAIVVLMHEGGLNAGTYNQCVGISEPLATMAATSSAPRSTRSSRVTPTTPTSAPSRTRPATRGS